MSTYSLLLCCWKRVFVMTSAFSWQNSISLCPASFRIPRPNLPVMVFPVVMYGCESWTVKKAERWRIDAFELCYWRRLLRIPWTSRRCNQSILKEISPGCSLEGLVLILKLQYLATHEKSWLIGKDPDAGRDWGQEKGMTEDEIAGWHHRLNEREFG